jgi:hypothetical protein
MLFASALTFDRFDSELAAGATIKVTRLSSTFGFEEFRSHYKDRAWPLFVIDDKRLFVVTAGAKLSPKPEQLVVSLVQPAAADSVDLSELTSQTINVPSIPAGGEQ